LLGNVALALASGKNIAVHCRQGVGRSGLISAALLMTAGIRPQEAMAVVSKARGVVTPETPGQVQWLEQLTVERLAIAS
jgi:protein-tyrosine phosphatase